MRIHEIFSNEELSTLAKARYTEERSYNRLDGWFLAREIARECDEKYRNESNSIRIAKTLKDILEGIPLTIGCYNVFAGTQDDAFARSYALINPEFSVKSFTGYCDPAAVFNDILPDEQISQERIEALRQYTQDTEYVTKLNRAYEIAGDCTSEGVFFIEQVTGHLIPDVRMILSYGIDGIKEKILHNKALTTEVKKLDYYDAMLISLEALTVLTGRYAGIAGEMALKAVGKEKEKLAFMEDTLNKLKSKGAESLYEAIQLFILIWQTMCMEQAPNPYAFSTGNIDRIFEPFRQKEGLGRSETAALLKSFLVFFNVADRSWAISQNLMVGGQSKDGADLTSLTTYAVLDAYYDMNLPQPILSVKYHKNTPEELHRELGKFFFSAGVLTPSLFNDEAMFKVLKLAGIQIEDLPDYSIAGCQEPLIMGRDNGNTTNSWLNLAKILELTINDGVSSLTRKKAGLNHKELGYENREQLLLNIKEAFKKQCEYFIPIMVKAANAASEAVSVLQVPFLSIMMEGIESGVDIRDTKHRSTKYNASGCLIHGLSVVADSFAAIQGFLKDGQYDVHRLFNAVLTDFEGEEKLRQYLLSFSKYGNNIPEVDNTAAEIVTEISTLVENSKNYLGNSFRPDYATPSTHLLYGYKVGATPDGRHAREMLGYGIDPLYGEAGSGMGFRILSSFRLPYAKMCGGYASHFGIDPKYFKGGTFEEKGIEFRDKVINPLFFNPLNKNEIAPFYLYVNVTTPEILRKVLANPKKYAPSGVYIVRIHGTFVNFLDLSPDIQNDIIKRLDLSSTAI